MAILTPQPSLHQNKRAAQQYEPLSGFENNQCDVSSSSQQRASDGTTWLYPDASPPPLSPPPSHLANVLSRQPSNTGPSPAIPVTCTACQLLPSTGSTLSVLAQHACMVVGAMLRIPPPKQTVSIIHTMHYLCQHTPIHPSAKYPPHALARGTKAHMQGFKQGRQYGPSQWS